MTLLLLLACSTAQGEDRFDVHQAMRDENTESCDFCHEEDGESLRVPAPNTCDGCHKDGVHAGTPEHVGVALSEGMSTELPLRDGLIACVTCHDPHPSGTVKHRPALKPDRTPSWWPGHPGPSSDTLRLSEDAICTDCHGEGP